MPIRVDTRTLGEQSIRRSCRIKNDKRRTWKLVCSNEYRPTLKLRELTSFSTRAPSMHLQKECRAYFRSPATRDVAAIEEPCENDKKEYATTDKLPGR